jgi:hypothetical protein
MSEIEHIQTIIIAKALYGLRNIQQTVRKYKCQKRALNKIERTADQVLHEIELVNERLVTVQQKRAGPKCQRRQGKTNEMGYQTPGFQFERVIPAVKLIGRS